MKFSTRLERIAFTMGLVASIIGIQPASAQDSATAAAIGVAGTIVPATSRTIADARPTIVIMNFESGTVMAKVKDKHGFSAFMAAMRGDREKEVYDPAELGAGIADMLVEKLLNSGEFRLLERKRIEAAVREQMIAAGANPGTAMPSDAAIAARASLIGARYIITGSVTKFGFEQHRVGGIFLTMATYGMLSVEKHKTEVKLTARVIDVNTGEIVASFDGEGVSNKGGGVSLFGMAPNGGGGAGGENRDFKETAIGEATERAVQNLTETLGAKRSLLAMK